MSQKIKSLFFKILFMSCVLLGISSCTQRRLNWMVYYGQNLSAEKVKSMDWAVTEPDFITPNSYNNVKIRWHAYLSVGEVHDTRPYFHFLQEKGVITSPKENWVGAYAVDVRSPVWKEMVLKTLIPSFIAKGYQGVFLDTIDTALAEESSHPGSRKAMIALIHDIKKHYPALYILSNNGLEILPEIQNDVSGVVVEDLYTHYDFQLKKSRATDRNVSEEKESVLDRFLKSTGKPVLNLLYDENAFSDLVRQSMQRCKEKKYECYWSRPDLGGGDID